MARFQRLLTLTTQLACNLAWLKWYDSPIAEALASTGSAAMQLVTGALQEASQRPDGERVLRQIASQVREEFLHTSHCAAVDADELAQVEDLLCEHLPECFNDRATIAACAVDPRGFQKSATDALLDAVADTDGFLAAGSEHTPTARAFAEAIVASAVRAAIGHEDYFRALAKDVLLEMGQTLGKVAHGVGRVESQIAAVREHARAIAEEQARALQRIEDKIAGEGIPSATLRSIAASYFRQSGEVFIEELESYLALRARDYREARTGLAELGAGNSEATRLFDEAREALERGEFAEADDLLKRAEESQRPHAVHSVHDLVHTLELRAKCAMLLSDYRKAADLSAQAIAMLDLLRPEEALNVLTTAARAFESAGFAFPERKLLLRAVELWRRVTEHPHASNDVVADAYHNCANCLSELGSRNGEASGTRYLRDAIAAYHASLQRLSSAAAESVAIVTANLGATLTTQSTRPQGIAGERLLDEAEAELRKALLVISRESRPRCWGLIQNNLGQVSLLRGERLGGAFGAQLLASAAEAFRAALAVFTAQVAPTRHVLLQNNLSYALMVHGSRSAGAVGDALLAQAVAASRAGLKIAAPSKLPVHWAKGLGNLGVALVKQSERTGDAAVKAGLLSEAIDSYRAALLVSTCENMSAQWGKTMNNLAHALQTRAKADFAALMQDFKEAAALFRKTLKIYTRLHMPVDRALVQNNLGGLCTQLAMCCAGKQQLTYLNVALKQLRAALRVRTREHLPVDYATTKNNLGCALLVAVQITEDPERGRALAHEAVSAFRDALTVRTRETLPVAHERTMQNLRQAEKYCR